MSYYEQTKPPVRRRVDLEIDKKHITGILLSPIIGISVACILILISHSFGASGYFKTFYSISMTSLVAAIPVLLWSFRGIVLEVARVGRMRSEFDVEYQVALKKYNQYIDHINSEKYKMAIAQQEHARRVEMYNKEEENRQIQRERELEIKKNEAEYSRVSWCEAFELARSNFEQAYHAIALQLATEHGITRQEDIIKVFVEAYPYLPASLDWRMGCLREIAAKDPRVAAIEHLLPSPTAWTTRPS